MKATFHCCALALLLLVTVFPASSQEAAKKGAAGDPAKSSSLRQPGFVFLELGTDKVADHIAFFQAVADFKVIENEGNWAWLQSERGDLMFNSGDLPNKGKPPGTARLPGVEIGLVVADLDKAFATVAQFKDKGFNITERIARRPWGPRDFRLLTPQGYYVRVTEPM